ncbi:hypothetical protein [Clostridium sp.]|uniref:CsxC family protein n=1 Tax=Clostridium sp. TaxID=1506 RepID=UPI002FC80A5F
MSQEKKISINNENNQRNTNCDSKELNHSMAIERSNEVETIKERANSLITKIPIVLSEVEIEISIEKEFKLKKSATYVKTIDKHTVITQCDLIPHTDKLFVEGYVQKSIWFYHNEISDKSTTEGKLKHITLNIPFKAINRVKFQNEPIYGENYKKSITEGCIGDKKNHITENSWVYYNKPDERIYCELEDIKIMETDTFNTEGDDTKDLQREHQFRNLVIKMVIQIGLKVFQKQSINISQSSEFMKLVQSIIENNMEHKESEMK